MIHSGTENKTGSGREEKTMTKEDKPFEITKSFGLGVLLKLTKNNCPDIKIINNGKTFTSNVTLNKMTEAVNDTLESHHIRLKVG
jgi:hypothetical protein